LPVCWLARLKETESALLFPTGYMTNLGVLQALGSEDTEIFSDELNHASIIDGCRLSRSKISVYRHCDTNHLESLVKSSTAESKLVITESVFSMDGDLAPLRELCEIKSRYNFMLVVDEAHATLVYGPKGRGLSHQLGVSEAIDIQVGTLSKAVGSIGGFVALSSKLKSYLINRARAYIFTTSLPIPNVVASLKAVEVATRDELLRERLWQNIEAFSDRLNLAAYGPIIPILLGSEQMATRASEQLMAEGFHVPAIRPPTVPPGTSRLRITLSSEHLPEHLDQLSELIEKIQA
jgi:8-amino-7-oxononanoate synthase